MKTPSHLLVVDDEPAVRDAAQSLFTAAGYQTITVETAMAGVAELERAEVDVVLADLSLPRVSGLELLDRIQRSWPTTEVIVITGQASIATAVDAIKRGAYHYVTKPFTAEEILHLVAQACERRRLRARKERLEEELSQARGIHQLVGQSAPLEKIRQVIQAAAVSEATVLVQGESGTGKEIIATAVHTASRRAHGPLVKLNCAAVPETLLESELFGHEKGAFTGADRRRLGRFEQAEGGRSFSTRCARCIRGCRRSCCARSRSGRSSGWGGRGRWRWTCGSLRRRTGTWRRRSRTGRCARTCTIA